MAFFTKDEYEGKADYAYRKSIDGIAQIAQTLGVDEEDIEPIARLSHKRHEVHSTDIRQFIRDSSELIELRLGRSN